MNKVAHYLQQHLSGEVLTSPDVLDYFSTDESIFQIRPLLVAHPRSENDLRKTARFSWQLSERGRSVPITIRGKGTDQTGASLGSGIILSMPAHMNKIIELDPKSGVVTVQAGINASKLQQTLHTHGRWLPSMNESSEYTTIGGSIANNDAGPTSYKYGPMREHVQGLRVVLANGELIQVYRLSKRELNKKLGLASFEGEIYRSLDKLIEESHDAIESIREIGDRNNTGYDLPDVKLKDGSFDLTPLFTGSQGTLGLISEISLQAQIHNPQADLEVALFSSRKEAFSAVHKINSMKQSPLAIDFIDSSVVKYVSSINPSLYKSTLDKESPEIILFIYTETGSGDFKKRSHKNLKKILEENNADIIKVSSDNRDSWEAAKNSISVFITDSKEQSKPIPLIKDAYVPVENCATFLDSVDSLLEKISNKPYIVWGQAGSGLISVMQMFDISTVGDKQKMFKLLDQYYSLVAESGGSVAGAHAEGRLQASQNYKVLTEEVIQINKAIKKIFDPYNMLNPGVKVGTSAEDLKQILRSSYFLDHQHSHIVRN